MPIKKCNCTNAYQDTQYGKDMRVQNITMKGKVRCTICGRENDYMREDKVKPVKK